MIAGVSPAPRFARGTIRLLPTRAVCGFLTDNLEPLLLLRLLYDPTHLPNGCYLDINCTRTIRKPLKQTTKGR